MTDSLPWPYNAKHTRDDVAALLQRIVRRERKLIHHPDDIVAANAGRNIDDAHRAIRLLMQVGAQIQEDNL